MDVTYKPLAEVENGELIVASMSGETHLGVKGFYKDVHFVLLLAREIDGAPGPYTLVDLDKSWNVVALGRDWLVDFDPVASIQFDARPKPALGSLLLSPSGPLVVSHNESGRHGCSLDGQLGQESSRFPAVANWRIMLRKSGHEFEQVLRWPIPTS